MYKRRQNPPNVAYPNVVFEIAHKHESWQKLIDNATRRALCPLTSIQAIVGMKIFKNHIRCFLMVRGGAQGPQTIADTGKISKRVPTQATITIPQAVVWWGTPQPLPATPPFVLPIEQLRIPTARFT